MKEFNKKMKQLRSSIKCIACGKVPVSGVDTIDNWAINDKDGITLLCEECYQEQKEVPQDEN